MTLGMARRQRDGEDSRLSLVTPRRGVLVRVDEGEYPGEGGALREDGPQVPEPEEGDHKPDWSPVYGDVQ